MAAKAVPVCGFVYAVMRFVALIAVEPRHRGVARKDQFFRFPVARETHLMARHGVPLFFRRERMTHKTRCFILPDAVNFLSFMTAAACMIFGLEGVHGTAVAVHT